MIFPENLYYVLEGIIWSLESIDKLLAQFHFCSIGWCLECLLDLEQKDEEVTLRWTTTLLVYNQRLRVLGCWNDRGCCTLEPAQTTLAPRRRIKQWVENELLSSSYCSFHSILSASYCMPAIIAYQTFCIIIHWPLYTRIYYQALLSCYLS